MLLYNNNIYHFHSKNINDTLIYWSCFDKMVYVTRMSTTVLKIQIKPRENSENYLKL